MKVAVRDGGATTEKEKEKKKPVPRSQTLRSPFSTRRPARGSPNAYNTILYSTIIRTGYYTRTACTQCFVRWPCEFHAKLINSALPHPFREWTRGSRHYCLLNDEPKSRVSFRTFEPFTARSFFSTNFFFTLKIILEHPIKNSRTGLPTSGSRPIEFVPTIWMRFIFFNLFNQVTSYSVSALSDTRRTALAPV